MKVGLLTCDQPWQRTLARRLAAQHDLAVVVVDQHLGWPSRLGKLVGSTVRSPVGFLRKIHDKGRVHRLERRDGRVYAQRFGSLGAAPFSAQLLICAPDVNSPVVADALSSASLDAIVVSGTRLIGPPVSEVQASLGVIGLHTGLSPYYRGGPCTFWTLYDEQPEYAGATVYHLTPGIDSGDIVLSARANLEPHDRLASLDCKVIELGHGLVLRALELLEQGRAPRVPQWEKGRLFLYKQFNADVRLDLERRLESGLVERCLARPAAVPRTVEA